MCTPNMNLGTTDVMSPQERLRYAEAMGTLPQPKPEPVVQRDDTYVPPKGATIKMPDGRMITKESYEKLQAKLKQRKG